METAPAKQWTDEALEAQCTLYWQRNPDALEEYARLQEIRPVDNNQAWFVWYTDLWKPFIRPHYKRIWDWINSDKESTHLAYRRDLIMAVVDSAGALTAPAGEGE